MLLIKNVQIVDGTGKPAYPADVLVRGNKISAIGTFPNKKATVTINGNGAYCAPGFIDVNTDSDHYLTLFSNPEQQDFLLQGVTTIIGGNCGSSLAPLLRGDLRSIRKWTNPDEINVDWHSVGEFLNVLERRGLGINFGTLVGHSTVRRSLIGEALHDLTDDEMASFKSVMSGAMKEGAFGMSTGLAYVHARQSPYAELKELLRVVKQFNGVYATHLRDEEGGLLESVNETFELAAETGVKTIVSHLRPLVGYEQEFRNAMRVLNERASDLKMYFDVYPSDKSIITIYRLLPEWAQNGSFEVMIQHLATATTRNRILKEMKNIDGDRIIIGWARGYPFLSNKTLSEFAKNRGMSVGEGLVELMRVTNLQAVVFYQNIDLELLLDSLKSPHALIASNGASFPVAGGMKQERSHTTFPKFLTIVAQRNNMPVEEAVRRITSFPAAVMGLKNRGVLSEGGVADITLFKGEEVRHVIVGGRVAVEDGACKNIFAGSILRRS